MELDSPIHTRIKETRIRDLEQRLSDLEALLGKPRGDKSALPHLRNLYLDLRLGKIEYTPGGALLWEIAVGTLTRKSLFDLGCAVGDPFVWRWFMETTLEFTWRGFEMSNTYERLRELAKEVLYIQGARVLGVGGAANSRVITAGKNKGKSPISI